MDPWNRISHTLTHHAGSKWFFGAVAVLTVAWAVVGLVAGPSRAWELSVTCGVPIDVADGDRLQHAQSRDSKATQLKLNELLIALEEPDSRIIRAGTLGDEELNRLGDEYNERA